MYCIISSLNQFGFSRSNTFFPPFVSMRQLSWNLCPFNAIWTGYFLGLLHSCYPGTSLYVTLKTLNALLSTGFPIFHIFLTSRGRVPGKEKPSEILHD